MSKGRGQITVPSGEGSYTSTAPKKARAYTHN